MGKKGRLVLSPDHQASLYQSWRMGAEWDSGTLPCSTTPLSGLSATFFPDLGGRRDLWKRSCLNVEQNPEKFSSPNFPTFAHASPTLESDKLQLVS